MPVGPNIVLNAIADRRKLIEGRIDRRLTTAAAKLKRIEPLRIICNEITKEEFPYYKGRYMTAGWKNVEYSLENITQYRREYANYSYHTVEYQVESVVLTFSYDSSTIKTPENCVITADELNLETRRLKV